MDLMNSHNWPPIRVKHAHAVIDSDGLILKLKPHGNPIQTDGTSHRAGPDLSQWIDASTGQSADIGRPERTRAYNAQFDKWYIMGLALRGIYRHDTQKEV